MKANKLVMQLSCIDNLIWGKVISWDSSMIKAIFMRDYASDFHLSSMGVNKVPKLTDNSLFILSSDDILYNDLPFIHEFSSDERALEVYRSILRCTRHINTGCLVGYISGTDSFCSLDKTVEVEREG